MMNLESIFKQVFDDVVVTDDRLISYAEVALLRLQNNNPDGKFTPLIGPFTSTLNDFKTAVADKNALKAQREGSTISVDDLIAEFKQKALQREGLIRDTFGVNSPEYQEFYPLGTSEYTRMIKTNADQLMRRMVTAYTNHAAKLPEIRVQEFSIMYNNYTAARTLQQERVAGISNKHVEKTQGRAALEALLQYNLLTIAREFIGQPDMYKIYFEHSLLFAYRHKSLERTNGDEEEDTGEYNLEVQPMSTARAEFSVSDTDTLNLYNDGEALLSVYTASTPDAAVPADAMQLEPEEEQEVAVNQLGPAGSSILLVNNNTEQPGSIEIAML